MMTFKRFQKELAEGRLANVSALSAAAMIMKIRALDAKIQNSKDPIEQNKLLSQQSKFVSYITGMNIAVSASDSKLLARINKAIGSGRKAKP